MSDRTFQWWRFKLGFQGDAEFVRLAVMAPNLTTYYAALGLLLTIYDTAHRKDTRTPPRGTIVDPGGDLLALLVEAGVLDEGGAIPEGTWSKYRVADRARDERGHFLPNSHVAPRGHHRGPNTETETERTTPVGGTNEERAKPKRTGPERVTPDDLKDAPWNKRGRA